MATKKTKKYKGLKSSVKKSQSSASKMAEERNKRQKKSSTKYKGISKSAAKPNPKKVKSRAVRIMPMKANLVDQLPDTSLTKKGKTLKQLLRSTPKLMKYNAAEVDLTKYKKSKTKSGLPAITALAKHKDPFRPDRTAKKREVYIVGLEMSKPISKQKKVLVSCNCVTGDTKVMTSKGWQTVYEIAAPMDIESFPITYVVNGKPYKGTAPFNTGIKPVHRLVLSNGESIEATADHRFMVKPSRGEPEWRELKNINIGDNLVLSANCGSSLPDKTDVFYAMQYLGFMQGDGTVFANGYPDLRIFAEDKMEMIDKLSELQIVDDLVEVEGGTRIKFNIRAYEIMRKYGYDNSGTPCFSNKEQFLGYLSGLISADASISSKDGKIMSLLIRGDKSYLGPVFDSLLRIGYTDSTLRLEREAGTETNIATASKDMHCLKISAKTLYRLKDYLELTARFDNYEFKEFRDLTPKATVTDKLFVANKHVYDILVPKINMFVGNGGLLVHNCENFVFTWEYANAIHGAAKLIYGNGDPAGFTNPSNVPGLCKHLAALASRVINNGD